jgi:hypothetical protein
VKLLPSPRKWSSESTSGIPQAPNLPGLPEWLLWLVIPLVFITVGVTYIQLEITLMSLMTASRWMIFFWAVSFLLFYVLRGKLRLDLTDGMILSIFASAPLLMAGMLTMNRCFHEPFIESHRIVNIELDNAWAVIFLENDAYNDFYRIRRFPVDRYPMGDSVTYHFGSGLLGYTVMTGCEW